MSIAVLGVNHRTAPLEVRERFAHAAHEVPGALARVLSAGAEGGVLLSTCNRTEFYLADPRDAVSEAVWALLGERLSGDRAAQAPGYETRPSSATEPRRFRPLPSPWRGRSSATSPAARH